MKINDACLVDAAVQLVYIIGKLNTMVLNDVAGTAHRSSRIVAVLCHLVTRTRNDEAGSSRNVKGVLAVATGSHHVNVAVTIQDGWHACGKNSVTETEQFIYRYTSHLQTGEQGCNLFLRKCTLGDSYNDVSGFLTRKFLVVQHSVQNVLHFHS